MVENRRGFHVAAPQLLKSGWLPMPLPEGKKKSPPEGFTGGKPEAVEKAEDPELWKEAIRPFMENDRYASWNTGIRLPENVLALDIDEYVTQSGHQKSGWNELVLFAESMGLEHPKDSLPRTIRVTSRGSRGMSGQRFYRLPEGSNVEQVMKALPGVLVNGVEILRPHHRYTIEAGSLHPEGGIYRVYDERGGKKSKTLPKGFGSIKPEELPELPKEWLEAILAARPNVTSDQDDAAMGSEARSAAHDALEEWIEEHDLDVDDLTDSDVLGLLSVGAKNAVAEFGSPDRNNANVAAACIALLATLMEDISEDGEGGLPIRHAIDIAKRLYVKNGNRHDRPGEFDRALVWAFPNARRSVLGNVDTASLDWAKRVIEDDFWGQTETLRSCRDYARAKLVSPDAMLACALVIVSSWLPPHMVLPGLVGAEAGLNFYVALAAVSGGGKTAAMKAAENWLDVTPHPHSDPATDRPYKTTVSTAQGLIQSYTLTRPRPKGQQVRPGELDHIQIRRSVTFEVDEIGALGAAMQAEGSMLKDFLKTMWTGGGVGTTAAEAARVRHLDDHSFRMTIVAGVQPATADVILSGHGDGFPQRWLWVEVADDAPLTQEEWEEAVTNPPNALEWEPPLAAYPLPMPDNDDDDENKKIVNAFNLARQDINHEPFEVLEVTDSFRNKVFRAAQARRRIDDSSASMDAVLDGHSVLLQEKLAALIAALHGHVGITDQFERMAEYLTNKSDNVRAAILRARQEETDRRMDAQAARQGRSAVMVEEERVQTWRSIFLGRAVDALSEEGGELPVEDLMHLATGIDTDDKMRALDAHPMIHIEGDIVKLDIES